MEKLVLQEKRGQKMLKRCLWVDLDLFPNFFCVFLLIVYYPSCLSLWDFFDFIFKSFYWMFCFYSHIFYVQESFFKCPCFMDTMSFLSLKLFMVILSEVFFSLHDFYYLLVSFLFGLWQASWSLCFFNSRLFLFKKH